MRTVSRFFFYAVMLVGSFFLGFFFSGVVGWFADWFGVVFSLCRCGGFLPAMRPG